MRKKILLIGAGKFGENHLRALRQLEKEKKLILVGVVVRSKKSRDAIRKKYGITVFNQLRPDILKKADAVDIVTPASTHYEIVKKCLLYAHVFVEKPLSMTASEGKELEALARRHKKILAVGHIFRFNDAVKKLKKIIQPQKKNLYYIEGKFIGGSGEPARDCGVITSDMHLFDVLDYILDGLPLKIYCRSWTRLKGYKFEDQAAIILDYPGNIHAYLKLGWVKAPKVRSVAFYFSEKEVHADLMKQTITIQENSKKKITLHCFRKRPLRMELEGFIKALQGKRGEYIRADVANRITGIVERVRANA